MSARANDGWPADPPRTPEQRQDAYDALVMSYRRPCDCAARGDKWCTYRWPTEADAARAPARFERNDRFPEHFAPHWVCALAYVLVRWTTVEVAARVLAWCGEDDERRDAAVCVVDAERATKRGPGKAARAAFLAWVEAQGFPRPGGGT